MLKNKSKPVFAALFITAELVLGVLIQTVDNGAVKWLSYGAVLLASLYPVLLRERTAVYTFTQVGLVFTVFADLFLVVIEPMRQLEAMIFFSLVQICYFLRLYISHESTKEKAVHLAVRATLTVVALVLTAVVLGDKTDALSLISLFYYANLITNIAVAFSQLKKSPLLAIGLLLFLLCDTVIGLNIMAGSYISIASDSLLYRLINPGFNLAWVFYVPSQTLIALSLYKTNKKI